MNMTTQPINTLDIPTEIAAPETADVLEIVADLVGPPDTSNPAEPTDVTVDVGAPGNPNGNSQSENKEPDKTPTARDTLAEKRRKLNAELAELDKQEMVADVADLAVIALNKSGNEKLKVAKLALEADTQISLLWDFDKQEFRYAELGKKIVTISPPNGDGTPANRSWFTKVISPDGVEHEAPMKTAQSNDVKALSEIVGIDLSKDGNGNSTSTLGKSNMLKKANWTFKGEGPVFSS